MTLESFANLNLQFPTLGLMMDTASRTSYTDQVNMMTEGQHFDNLSNMDSINENFTNFVNKQDFTTSKGVGDACHAIQDFYAHSNYVEIYCQNVADATPQNIQSYEEVMSGDNEQLKNSLKENLRTGTFSLAGPKNSKIEGPNSHEQMNKDTPNSISGSKQLSKNNTANAYDYARAAAVRHTTQFLEKHRDEIERMQK
ncbi:MAG: Het-C domain-containing protein [Rhodopseudomonas palustris]|nr:Het-C domain-containing protein [Rhodopseudomonas palustris]